MAAKIYSIIPARGGSKGIPKKNIRLLGDWPLIAYSIAVSKLTPSISRTILCTDSEEIAAIGKKFGAEVPFLRPAEISGDHSTDYEFFAYSMDWFQKNEGTTPDYWVHLRPTTPLRIPELVEDAIQIFLKHPEATALRSVHEMSESAYKAFEVDENRLKSVGSGKFELDAANNARQKFPQTYQANGYVDLIRADFLVKNQRIHGGHVQAYITPKVVEVDTLDEFDYLQYLIGRDPSIARRLFGG